LSIVDNWSGGEAIGKFESLISSLGANSRSGLTVVDPPDGKSLADIRLGISEDIILSLEISLAISIGSLDNVSNIILSESSTNNLILGHVVGIQVLCGKSSPLGTSIVIMISSFNMPVSGGTVGISHSIINSSLGVLSDLMLSSGNRAASSNRVTKFVHNWVVDLRWDVLWLLDRSWIGVFVRVGIRVSRRGSSISWWWHICSTCRIVSTGIWRGWWGSNRCDPCVMLASGNNSIRKIRHQNNCT